MSQMVWLSEEDSQTLQALHDNRAAYAEVTEKAAHIMATMMFCYAILSDAKDAKERKK